MPILAAMPQLERPTVRPLVARRLKPPVEARKGAWDASTPVETTNGLVWTTNARTLTPKGAIAFTIPGGQAVWANLARRWWSYGIGGGAGLVDAATGQTRSYPGVHGPVDDAGIDEHGVPVGLRDVAGAVYGRPARGETALKLPTDFVDSPRMYSTVIAAPKGSIMAGALTIGDAESPRTLPFLWVDDAAEPRALPVPEGTTQTLVSAMNSRGDVAGLVVAPGRPDRAVIWCADGGTTLVPVGARHSDDRIRDADAPGRWSAWEPLLLTDDGVLIGRELARDRVYGHITTYWDGRRTIWLPDAIAGVHAVSFDALRLAADGRSLLARIWDGRAWGWYRISPR